MNKTVILFAFVALVAVCQCAPAPGGFISGYNSQDQARNDLKKSPAKIAFLETQQSRNSSNFRYNDTDGTSRWETVEYESVKNGDKEAVVPRATGGHEYVSPEGVRVKQTYISGADGQNIITILDFKGHPDKQ